MALTTCIAVRFAVAGDGESKLLRLDLQEQLFEFNGKYFVLPRLPHRIVSIAVGGPNVNPESPSRNALVCDLNGPYLDMMFTVPMIDYALAKETYTVEIVFGFDGVPFVKKADPEQT